MSMDFKDRIYRLATYIKKAQDDSDMGVEDIDDGDNIEEGEASKEKKSSLPKSQYEEYYNKLAEEVVDDFLDDRSQDEVRDKLSEKLFDIYQKIFEARTYKFKGRLKELLEGESIRSFFEQLKDTVKDIFDYLQDQDKFGSEVINEINTKIKYGINNAIQRNISQVVSKESGVGRGQTYNIDHSIRRIISNLPDEDKIKMQAIESAFKSKNFDLLKRINMSVDQAKEYLFDKVKNYKMDEKVYHPKGLWVEDSSGNKRKLDESKIGNGFSWAEVLNQGPLDEGGGDIKQKQEELFNKLIGEYGSFYGSVAKKGLKLKDEFYSLLKGMLVKRGSMHQDENFVGKLADDNTIKMHTPPKSSVELYEKFIKPAWMEQKGTTGIETTMGEGGEEELTERTDILEKVESPEETYIQQVMAEGTLISQRQLGELIKILNAYVSSDEKSRTSIEMAMDRLQKLSEELESKAKDPSMDDNTRKTMALKKEQIKQQMAELGKNYIDTYILEWYRDILKDDFSGRDLAYELLRLNVSPEKFEGGKDVDYKQAAQKVFYETFVGGSGQLKWNDILNNVVEYLVSNYGIERSQLVSGGPGADLRKQLIGNAWNRMFEIAGQKIESIGLEISKKPEWLESVKRLSSNTLRMYKNAISYNGKSIIGMNFRNRIKRLASVIYAQVGYEGVVSLVDFLINYPKYAKMTIVRDPEERYSAQLMNVEKLRIQYFNVKAPITGERIMIMKEIMGLLSALYKTGIFITQIKEMDPTTKKFNIMPSDVVKMFNERLGLKHENAPVIEIEKGDKDKDGE